MGQRTSVNKFHFLKVLSASSGQADTSHRLILRFVGLQPLALNILALKCQNMGILVFEGYRDSGAFIKSQDIQCQRLKSHKSQNKPMRSVSLSRRCIKHFQELKRIHRRSLIHLGHVSKSFIVLVYSILILFNQNLVTCI